MPEAIETAFAELKKAHEDMKKDNDKRIAVLEKNGHAPADFEEKFQKQNEAIEKIEEKIVALDKKSGRPGTEGAGAEGATKRKAAFGKYLRKGDARMTQEDLEILQKTGYSTGTDSEGGYAVPEELDRQIMSIAYDATPMRQLCDVIVAGVGYHSIADIGGETTDWVDEDDSHSEQTAAAFADMVPTFGEVYSFFKATQHAVDDVFFDLEGFIATTFGRAFGKAEDAAFVSGNGTKKPKGILAYTLATTDDDSRAFGQVQKVLSNSDAQFNGDNLIDVIYACRDEYLQNAKWVMKRSTVAYCRKLTDGNGNYLWQPGAQAGQPSLLMGYPVYADANMETIAADAKVAMFGDFKRAYRIVDVKGIRTLRDPFTAHPKIAYKGSKRTGGGLRDSLAVKILVTGD